MDSSSTIQNLSTSEADERHPATWCHNYHSMWKITCKSEKQRSFQNYLLQAREIQAMDSFIQVLIYPSHPLENRNRRLTFCKKLSLSTSFWNIQLCCSYLFYPLLHHPPSPRFPLNNWGLILIPFTLQLYTQAELLLSTVHFRQYSETPWMQLDTVLRGIQQMLKWH